MWNFPGDFSEKLSLEGSLILTGLSKKKIYPKKHKSNKEMI
jgi:hypothetical protein